MTDQSNPGGSRDERIPEKEPKIRERMKRQWFHPDTPIDEIVKATLEAAGIEDEDNDEG